MSLDLNQGEFWSEHVRELSIDDVLQTYENPSLFQKELCDLITSYIEKEPRLKDIIEVGCETGTTSVILSDSLNKTLLDLSPQAIKLAEAAAAKTGKRADFYVADMFDMPFADDSFDIVFNAGVIEHFDLQARTKALTEYARILRNDGVMFVAFPNQYSPPYRAAYVLRKLFKKLRYPEAEKLYDMKKEIDANNLILEKRVVLSKGTVFNWLNFVKPLKKIFLLLDKVFNFEGYLTVLVLRKAGGSV